MTYSYVEKKYGPSYSQPVRNNITLDGNVFPDMTLDWMKALMTTTPLKQLGEFYWVHEHQFNDPRSFFNKWIEKDAQSVAIVEAHFESIGMPFINGFVAQQDHYLLAQWPKWPEMPTTTPRVLDSVSVENVWVWIWGEVGEAEGSPVEGDDGDNMMGDTGTVDQEGTWDAPATAAKRGKSSTK